MRRPVLADHDHLPSSSSGHHGHRPGVVDDVALEGGRRRAPEGPDPETMTGPGRSSPRPGGRKAASVAGHARPAHQVDGRLADGLDVDEVRVAPLGPGQRGADELAEQRVGPVGAALELGVGLGPHPERVPGRAR